MPSFQHWAEPFSLIPLEIQVLDLTDMYLITRNRKKHETLRMHHITVHM